jgi:hypothetical protein
MTCEILIGLLINFILLRKFYSEAPNFILIRFKTLQMSQLKNLDYNP